MLIETYKHFYLKNYISLFTLKTKSYITHLLFIELNIILYWSLLFPMVFVFTLISLVNFTVPHFISTDFSYVLVQIIIQDHFYKTKGIIFKNNFVNTKRKPNTMRIIERTIKYINYKNIT